jgi:flagellar biosynthesis component FlhA
MNNKTASRMQRFLGNTDVLMSIAVIAVILIMIIPLKPIFMDLFLVISLASSPQASLHDPRRRD